MLCLLVLPLSQDEKLWLLICYKFHPVHSQIFSRSSARHCLTQKQQQQQKISKLFMNKVINFTKIFNFNTCCFRESFRKLEHVCVCTCDVVELFKTGRVFFCQLSAWTLQSCNFCAAWEPNESLNSWTTLSVRWLMAKNLLVSLLLLLLLSTLLSFGW